MVGAAESVAVRHLLLENTEYHWPSTHTHTPTHAHPPPQMFLPYCALFIPSYNLQFTHEENGKGREILPMCLYNFAKQPTSIGNVELIPKQLAQSMAQSNTKAMLHNFDNSSWTTPTRNTIPCAWPSAFTVKCPQEILQYHCWMIHNEK